MLNTCYSPGAASSADRNYLSFGNGHLFTWIGSCPPVDNRPKSTTAEVVEEAKFAVKARMLAGSG